MVILKIQLGGVFLDLRVTTDIYRTPNMNWSGGFNWVSLESDIMTNGVREKLNLFGSWIVVDIVLHLYW